MRDTFNSDRMRLRFINGGEGGIRTLSKSGLFTRLVKLIFGYSLMYSLFRFSAYPSIG